MTRIVNERPEFSIDADVPHAGLRPRIRPPVSLFGYGVGETS